ncbi:long-chain-fatty-acid--CoA ligase [Acinetobacter rudis]|uniref:Long-chain-fatty-acid--CoA ligase n=1 Tax=Acinetobacter rudis TaxID=632955 RepID=A0AAW8JDP9_9GAMM|nr:long-chain-fatty-acid--CoA ligase [Acinetobacter rudis]MDQ8937226.1 long-chain-fatty-acid--CoA ligase [Acinetobacter rudis]MDQ9019437.1 long-chain-fatty-acid--CoA ligase [Acinetobacter rudis]
MQGRMMFQPLLISSFIEHAAQYHSDTAVISKNTDLSMTHTTWSKVANNAKRFAKALNSLGLQAHHRIATIAWNNHRHLEAWYAISGNQMICHTINPRLFPEQLIFIINDAQDRVILFDKTFLPLIVAVKAHIPLVEHFICLSDYDTDVIEALPEAQFYDVLVTKQNSEFNWPIFDETTASSLCYTSGTTGNPKGALYSHRSTALHSMAIALPDSMGLSAKDVMMPVVPMFHVNAWGTPYAAAMVGSTLVLPGPGLDGTSLVNLIDQYQVSIALGVPTIWQGLLTAAKNMGSQLSSMKRNVVGGSACPASMIHTFKDVYNCDTIHAWGMTETSPLGTAAQLKTKHLGLSQEEQTYVRLSQGRPPFGVSLRLCDQEQGTNTIPSDGKQTGNLQIKGHWIIDSYFGKDQSALTIDGWFDTGDIATVDMDGYLRISDRAKDLIKSGGEWISSVELENIALDFTNDISMAAVIAAKHPKWDERPILIAVKHAESQLTEAEILEYYAKKVAKWQIPDEVIFVQSIPLNGTGKILKKELREQFEHILLEE